MPDTLPDTRFPETGKLTDAPAIDGIPQSAPVQVWVPPARRNTESGWPVPPLLTAMRRGVLGLCPACGKARAFAGWLAVIPVCPSCTAPLGRIRADDAPPYFTIFIVAHVMIGALVALESTIVLSVTTEMLMFLPATLLLTLALIRPVKGATLGLMLRMDLANTTDEPS